MYAAELDPSTWVVGRVIVAPSVEWCVEHLGGTWVETGDPYAASAVAYCGPEWIYRPDRPDRFHRRIVAYEIDLAPTGGEVVIIGDLGPGDVTNQILSALAAVPSGVDGNPNTITLTGTYRVDGTVLVARRSHWVINAAGASFTSVETGGRNRSHWKIVDSDHITVNDVMIVGAHPNGGSHSGAFVAEYEGQHGFEIESSTDVQIIRPTISDVYGDFIYIGHIGDADPQAWSDGVLVEGGEFARCGRQGVAVVGARNATVRGCTFDGIARSLVDIEPNFTYGGATDFVFENNTAINFRLNMLANGGANGVTERVTFHGNHVMYLRTIIRPHADARRGPFTFTDNVAEYGYGNPTGEVMEINRVDGLTVIGNTQALQLNRSMYLVSVNDCTNVDVSGNTLTNASGQVKDVTP